MGALVASIRHKGMSIGEVVRQWIGARGHKLFLAFTWLSLTLVIAVFLELAAQTFAADPAVAFTATLVYFSGDGFWCRYLSLMVYLLKSVRLLCCRFYSVR